MSNNISGRLRRLEKRIPKKSWQDQVRQLVESGQETPEGLLRQCGDIISSTWPEWFKHLSQSEIEAIAEPANELIRQQLAPYSDTELEQLANGTYIGKWPDVGPFTEEELETGVLNSQRGNDA